MSLPTKPGPGTWVPEKDRDTRWYIFKKLFLCRVPNIQTMSEDYIRTFGMPTTGVSRYDTETANELIDTMLPISRMVELHKEGVNVRVQKYTDTKLIYEHITDHLNWWKEQLRTGLNTRGAPLEDLKDLDNFAQVVYKYAAPQFTDTIIESLLSRSMASLMTTRDSIMKPRVEVHTTNPAEEEKPLYPERVSMASVFNRPIANGKPKWR